MSTIQARHQELIQNLTIHYKTLVSLGAFAPTSLVLPPSSGHENIDINLLKQTGLSDEVIKLTLHLPYINGPELLDFDHDIAPHTQPVKYIDEDDFDWVRDPVYQDQNDTKSTHLLLTNPGTDGYALIYDTATAKLVPWRPMQDSDPPGYDEDSTDRPCNGGMYAHLTSYSPSELLGPWTRNLISLAWLPYRGIFVQEPTPAELEQGDPVDYLKPQYEQILLKRTLKNVYIAYGWDIEAGNLGSAKRNFDLERFRSEKISWEQRVGPQMEEEYI